MLSRVRLFVAPWTVACEAPLPIEFSRQEYWSNFLLQGIFLTQRSYLSLLCLLHWKADSFTTESLGKLLYLPHNKFRCLSLPGIHSLLWLSFLTLCVHSF